jgi:hypothetical protein
MWSKGVGAEAAHRSRESGGKKLLSISFPKRNLIHPMVQNKRVILNPSDIGIKHVSSQTDVF